MSSKQCEYASGVQGKGLQQTYKLEALHICVDETTKRVCEQRRDPRDETCILQHWVRDRMKNWWCRPVRRSQWSSKKQKTRKYFREEGVVNCQMLLRSQKGKGWDVTIKFNNKDMSLSKFWDLVIDREAWRATVHGVPKSWTWLSDWTELTSDPEKFQRNSEWIHDWSDFKTNWKQNWRQGA